MAKEELALEVVISGFRQFMSQMGQMDDATDDLGSSWEGVTGDAQRAGVSLASLAKGGLAVVAAGAAIAATAISAAGLALGNLAISSAPLEGIGDAFEIMSKRAGLALGDLRTAAAGTISDFELMRIANIALTGAGEELALAFGENLPRLMEIARIAARATGEDMNWMFLSLVSGIKRLSPRLIDNTGIMVRATEGQKAYAAILGITVAELTAEQKQLAMLYSVLEAGEGVLETFGEKQLTASERLAQVTASIQNLKDRIGLALLPALVALLIPIASLIEFYGPQLLAWAEIFGAWLGKTLPIAIEQSRVFLQEKLLPAIAAVSGFFTKTLIPALQSALAWFASAGDTVGTFVSVISDKLLPAITVLATWWRGTWLIIADFFVKAWETISSTVRTILNSVVPFIGERVALAKEFIEKEFGAAIAWFTENWPLIQETTRTVLEAISHIIDTQLGYIIDIWNWAWPYIQTILTGAWEIMETTVSAFLANIRTFIELVMNIIQGNWGDAWGNIKDIFSLNLLAIWEISKSVLDMILKLFGTSLEEIGYVIKWWVTAMVQGGKDLIMGMVQGVKEGAAALVQAVKGVIGSAIDKAKKLLGISSKSKIFEGIGMDMMSGLSDSLAKWAPIIQAQIQAATTPRSMPMLASGGGGDTTINYEYNSYLTTQSLTPPGGLALEFEAMAMTTR